MIGLTQQEKVEFERIKDEMWDYGYETAKKEFGWHPASELPPINEIGESQTIIAYDLNGYAFSAFYSQKRGWCDDDGRDNLEIEWWCYPPKEE